METVNCVDLPHCPVDGDWGEWGEWQKCDRNCIDGKQIRTRECNDPLPSNGGAQCLNPSANKDERGCPTLIGCPVHGSWGEWTAWTKCSVTCGNGTTERTRECDKPKPKYSGKMCEGITHEMHECKLTPCVIPTNATVTNSNSTLNSTIKIS